MKTYKNGINYAIRHLILYSSSGIVKSIAGDLDNSHVAQMRKERKNYRTRPETCENTEDSGNGA